MRLVASLQTCVDNLARIRSLSREAAREEVIRREQERSAFISNHFRVDAADPTTCDLVINSERFSTEQAVELILAARQQTMGKTT